MAEPLLVEHGVKIRWDELDLDGLQATLRNDYCLKYEVQLEVDNKSEGTKLIHL